MKLYAEPFKGTPFLREGCPLMENPPTWHDMTKGTSTVIDTYGLRVEMPFVMSDHMTWPSHDVICLSWLYLTVINKILINKNAIHFFININLFFLEIFDSFFLFSKILFLFRNILSDFQFFGSLIAIKSILCTIFELLVIF